MALDMVELMGKDQFGFFGGKTPAGKIGGAVCPEHPYRKGRSRQGTVTQLDGAGQIAQTDLLFYMFPYSQKFRIINRLGMLFQYS